MAFTRRNTIKMIVISTIAVTCVTLPYFWRTRTFVHYRSKRDIKDPKAWQLAQNYVNQNPTGNLWLAYLKYTSKTLTNNSCVACAVARPDLMAVPTPFNSSECYNERQLHNKDTGCRYTADPSIPRCDPSCKMRALHNLGKGMEMYSPVTHKKVEVADIKVTKKEPAAPLYYTVCTTCQFECFTSSPDGGIDVGHFPNCHLTWDVSNAHGLKPEDHVIRFAIPTHTNAAPLLSYTYRINNVSHVAPSSTDLVQQRKPLSDMWWLCGDHPRATLPTNWTGTCTQVVFLTGGIHLLSSAPQKHSRTRRRAPGGSLDPDLYIDVIGVPRGVPKEFKARNEHAAWWTSAIPFMGPIIEVNKNSAWINYLYYNQQCFINKTAGGMRGMSGQLAPTSQMTWQNRMALDMLLAEKGGVCVMFGEACCTFIPNNTDSNGTVTKAIEGLESLRDEWARNSGVDPSPWRWLDQTFGKWKSVFMSAIVSLIIFMAVIMLLGCCVIPLIRGLIMRAISAALSYQMTQCTTFRNPDTDSLIGSDADSVEDDVDVDNEDHKDDSDDDGSDTETDATIV
ncbi:uncharacterized protein LOC129605002 isoform X1 [Betta splendens]|uniref:Uncharacterized protein LOC129605002 isoform X1 n=1 Tax=Betta splendens TaxID=158456 RepID=A0A9W2Y7N2_BETSP|nr:uncharacterized protein LOC129605002 isoform X1 [Betta splendens]XP_055369975.1 uncharacterized protein LOC129605002 isoform X1 [Betta splendens]XP_055369976.1 uncharacterized protein LOC129605002 isoform X1 [Betta splendens]XP_055369977.1 uncharacterized protein LOC129605002 isoform X1 [Betta splendens]